MKKLLFLFILLAIPSFGQVRTFVDSLAQSDTTNHYVAQGYEFAVLTITLPNVNDTVKIYAGTNEASPKYGQIGAKDALTNDWAQVVTGNTSVNRKYFLLFGYRQKYLRLISTSNTATLYYTLEAY